MTTSRSTNSDRGTVLAFPNARTVPCFKRPHLKVSVRENGDEDMRIRMSDERGMTVEVTCEGVEIVEIQKTKGDFEAQIYFFTFEGFAKINIIGIHLSLFNR